LEYRDEIVFSARIAASEDTATVLAVNSAGLITWMSLGTLPEVGA
jgi:hypothetical protein